MASLRTVPYAISIHGLYCALTLSWLERVWPVEKTTILPLILTAAFVCARHVGLGSFCMMQARKAVESHALLPCRFDPELEAEVISCG